MAKYNFSYLGKSYEANTKKELYAIAKDQLNISKARVDKLTKGQGTIYVIKDGLNVTKMDIQKDIRPLLFKDFKIPKSKMTTKSFSKVIKDKKTKVSTRLPKDSDLMDIILKVRMELKFSADIVTRFKSVELNNIENSQEAIIEQVNIIIEEYMSRDNPELIDFDYDVISKYNNAEYDLSGMKLREANPLKIYNESVEMVESKDNCVIDYLLKTYKKISPKKIKALGDENGVTPDDLNKFCENYNIKYRCYDITKKLVSSFTPTKNKRSYKKMIIIAFNNHIYPLKNLFLNKFKVNKQIIYVEDIKEKLINYINEGNYPVDVRINKSTVDVISYETDDKVFTGNKDYHKIKDLFEKLGIADKIKPNIKIPSLISYLIPLYCKENIKSVWLNNDTITKDGYSYKNESIKFNESDVTTLDKNKCYSYVLKNLPYVISLDYKSDKVTLNPTEIIDHYMYIVEPEQHNILIPNTNVYTGYHVKYAQNEGVKMKIKEQITTTKHDNYFTSMIEDIYKYTDSSTAKDIINMMIGKMQAPMEGHVYSKYLKIANHDESNRTNGYSVDLTNDYKIFYEFEALPPSIYTMKPIAFQVKDQSRVMMYEKMKSLNIDPSKIIQCKTDSFSFVNEKHTKYKTSKDFDDWKYENYNPVSPTEYYNYDISFINDPIGEDCKLITGDAGNGKTYHIVNNILPNKKDTIVLTPSHATLRQYKKLKHNCSVIQKYSLRNEIPTEKNVIVDEIGMCNDKSWDMLIKCIYAGKSVYALGDFSQLKPVKCDDSFDNELLINSLFNTKERLEGNHRNDFKVSFYDKLRTTKSFDYLWQKVNKYNTDWKDAEYIIAYKNETKDLYNNLKLEHLGLEFGDVGCRVICKTNKLAEHEIYNNFIYTITNNEEEISLDDGVDIKTISIKDFNANFKPAYAITLYGVQGDNIKSYFYPEEDKHFINNRSAYTLISRLNTKNNN